MVDLINLISDEDKKNMENYIIKANNFYDDSFIGVDLFLQNWNKSKQRLFHLLGDKLIVEDDFCLEKAEKEMLKDIDKYFYDNLYDENGFLFLFKSKMNKIFASVENIDFNVQKTILTMIVPESVYENRLSCKTIELSKNISLSRKDFPTLNPKRDLKLAYNMNLMKAIKKVNDFFNLELEEEFNKFKIKISQIFNDKYITGTLCYSIHPFDFITMSDNANGWTSCMNWTEDNGGCYHAGTVEMMNSNNVICCYIKSKDKLFRFYGSEWNNKKWRQLLYVTPEIICGGWSYPYQYNQITTIVLNKLRELAKANLNWEYQYGPEPYNDMVHIYSSTAMDNQKRYRKYSAKKHNIIFDTKMMYNDFLNKGYDYKDAFLCIRNKVKKNTIISVSGKCNCIRCNTNLQNYIKITSDYNERYNANSMLCKECSIDLQCAYCKSIPRNCKIIMAKDKTNICEYCYSQLRKCPCCGEPFKPFNSSTLIQGKSSNAKIDWNQLTSLSSDIRNIFFLNGKIYIDKEVEHEYYNFKKCDKKYKDMNFIDFINMIEKKYTAIEPKNYFGFLDITLCSECSYNLVYKDKLKEYKISNPDLFCWPISRSYYLAKMDYIKGVKFNKYKLENLQTL